MNNILKDNVKEKLCSDGIWHFSDFMLSIYKNIIARFPCRDVAETEERYPTTKDGMGAYLDKFFARHYFQIQDSLLDYMTSEFFLGSVSDNCINVMDIGSGPAVASLAIADMFSCIMDALSKQRSIAYKVKLNFLLNDTSDICLGLGKEILFDYFKLSGRTHNIFMGNAFFLERPFPKTMPQIERIFKNLGTVNIANFSYVVVPLTEQDINIHSEILNIKKLCAPNGRILIVQDKYNEDLVRQIDNEPESRNVTHRVYSKQNNNDTYTYEYYGSLIQGNE
ncbi:MAG: hypothetical protein WC770_01965 [Phycisphaerae bacterium]|jgi:hypothetical protein